MLCSTSWLRYRPMARPSFFEENLSGYAESSVNMGAVILSLRRFFAVVHTHPPEARRSMVFVWSKRLLNTRHRNCGLGNLCITRLGYYMRTICKLTYSRRNKRSLCPGEWFLQLSSYPYLYQADNLSILF